MQHFEITKELLEAIEVAVENHDSKKINELLNHLPAADIALIIDELDSDERNFVLEVLPTEVSADSLVEIDPDDQFEVLNDLDDETIAQEYIQHADTDDAVDMLQLFKSKRRENILSFLEDKEFVKNIVDLLSYDEGTAGALMAKELIKVKDTYTIMQSVLEMRKQAHDIDNIYTVYVVDDNDILLGRLSVKKLITSNTRSLIKDIYTPKVRYVKTYEDQEEVIQIMKRYDLIVLPVVDEMNRLVGRITIDDVVDVIQEEADKDYQMASGISADVDQSDSVWQLTKARLPWLIIGLIGGMTSATVISGYETAIAAIPAMAFFIPLITATGGNVGVQSSAIIVQSLASGKLDFDGILPKLWKELSVAIINGLVIGAISMAGSYLLYGNLALGITVSASLFSVIIVASMMGTFIPLLLDKYNIDPALATGPFVTTTNDIIGLFVYFLVGSIVYGTFA